jgi:hypothetical protein
MARIVKRYESTVSGVAPFPIDMLRYDAARPEREEDSGSISGSLMRVDRNNARRIVRVVSDRPLTSSRWESFGWSVDETREVRF